MSAIEIETIDSLAGENGDEIAVIGMAGRFPGAKNIDELWENLKNGVESIFFLSEEELDQLKLDTRVRDNPLFVKSRGGELEDRNFFDASFFNYNPSEAEVMDPQIRMFHECAWEALEHSGYNSETYNGMIGLYAGASGNQVWEALSVKSDPQDSSGRFAVLSLNDKDFLCTRVAYKLNLRGPAVLVQTACSTSLVAIHMACQAILNAECDMALAGGVTVTSYLEKGYIYQEGMILSPDAHCRAFDARAAGTVGGCGVAVVIVKLLENAINDCDSIYAVVKGSALNNDGLIKSGYTAPGREGQTQVINIALQMAEVEAESITYVECHGTGTILGDPIEIEALKQAFNTEKKGYCAVGSIKTNLGHLDAATGAAGFIKTVLALKHKLIPPSLHFENPNPKINFENSPFYVNTHLKEWSNENYPLRAGVSSFGIGGTNAHVILEESPVIEPSSASREWKLLVFSAATRTALDLSITNLSEFLKKNPSVNLQDAAYTLQVGRKPFRYRAMAVCSDSQHAVEVLSAVGSEKIVTHQAKDDKSTVIFMFPGQGSQYVNMGLELYQKENVFREEMNRCFEILKSLMADDIKAVLYPGEIQGSDIDINQFIVAQPIIFLFEYALAKLLISWGIKPDAMIGYSFGEYTAACLSGVLSLEDALKLVVLRGRLIQQTPNGAMLSIPLPVEEVKPLLAKNDDLAIAIDNGPSTIVAGPPQAVAAFEMQLKAKKYMSMRVQTSHALHSPMMESILNPFEQGVRQLTRQEPQIPYISNVTGTWITGEETADPTYWVTHLKETVRFAEGIKELTGDSNALFLEIGPGRDLSVLVERYLDKDSNQKAINLVRPPQKNVSDIRYLLKRMGWIWLYGAVPNWQGLYAGEKRHRIPLPTYPFERIEFKAQELPTGIVADSGSLSGIGGVEIREFEDWFYIPSWRRSRLKRPEPEKQSINPGYLLFMDKQGLGARLTEELRKKGQEVVIVNAGETFTRVDSHTYVIGADVENDYKTLVDDLRAKGKIPGTIVHLWSLGTGDFSRNELLPQTSYLDRAVELGFHSPVFLAKAIGNRQGRENLQLFLVSSNMQEVSGGDGRYPEKSVIIGPCKNISLEYPHIQCRSIDLDIDMDINRAAQWEPIVRQLMTEFASPSAENIVAYRGNYRWVQVLDPHSLHKPAGTPVRLREKGVYLVTGGLGGVGLILAEYLAKSIQAKLVLIGRSEFPGAEQWQSQLENPDTDKGLKDKIRKLLELEKLGAEILVIPADVTDEKQVRAVFSRAEAQWGRVNGVIHAAGLPDGTVIQLRNREESEEVLSVKLQGTMALHAVLMEKKPDFFFLCSSMSSIVTAVGQVAYCSANAFLDAYAIRQSLIGDILTVSINWDRWKKTGLAVLAEQVYRDLTSEEMKGGITPEQGVDVFRCILDEEIPQVIMSTLDIDTLIQQVNMLAPGDSSMLDAIEENIRNKARYPRPELETVYVPPSSETEQCLAEIWSIYLGFEKVGIKDDFFELGGDSLKAMTISSKINKVLDTEIPLTLFFNSPTIEETARYINANKKTADLPGEIQPVEAREYYVLSPAQKRLYFLQQLDLEQIVYNENRIIFLEGRLDHQKLADLFRRLIVRHESYRTSYIMVDEEPVQKIHPASEVVFDLQHLTLPENQADQKEDERVEWIIRHFVRPFDLSQIPLFRAAVVETGQQQNILVIDLHHIAHDRTSSQILQEEISNLWLGLALPSLKLQYKDYAEWLTGTGQQKKLDKQKTHWLDQFQDEAPVLNLPIDYPRPAIQVFPGNTIHFEIDKAETSAINQLALKEETTMFMFLSSVFHILLSILGGQEDIVIGTPVAARTHSDLEPIIGMFVNTLALRNVSRPDQTFIQFLKHVKTNTLNAFENQDYPFEKLVDEVLKERDVSRNPIFDVMFVLQNIQLPEVKLPPDLTLRPYLHNNITSKFDLTLDVVEETDRLMLKYEYNTVLFKAATIKRFTGYYKRILAQVLENPRQKISEIELLSETEKAQILSDFNDTDAEYAKTKTIHQLFREQAERTPDRTAVMGMAPGNADQSYSKRAVLSYRELNEITDRLARRLIEEGVEADAIVGIAAKRSFDMIIGILGILKTGSAYLPIEPGFPGERIRYMIAESSCSLCIATDNTGSSIKEISPVRVLDIQSLYSESKSQCLTAKNQLNQHRLNNPASVAYVLYTSGSTGKPKGVLLDHRPLVNLIEWMNRLCPMKEDDVVLLQNPFTFDMSVWGLFAWSFYGASTCLLAPGDEKEPQQIINDINKYHVSVLHFVPALLSLFLEYVPTDRNESELSSLRNIFVSGEALSIELVEKFNKKLGTTGQAVLYNFYGPTETHVVSFFDCRELKNPIFVPIGKPISNTVLYILGKGAKPVLVPVGIVGELYIGGDCLARGYLNNPHLTAEKFVYLSPTSAGALSMYRTGDLARWLPDGNIEFLGRTDHQVKIRGFRIELAEIENHLLNCESVKNAVVVIAESTPNDKYICAYIVPDKDFIPEQLRTYLSDLLPDYMVPSFFINVDTIPLTANGKIDRKALPEPEITSAKKYLPPRNNTEKKLVEIWSEVLKVNKDILGIDASFFELGGHSLKATVMVSKIHKAFNIKIHLAEFFKTPSIRGVASFINRSGPDRFAAVPIAEKKEYYPLSSSQTRVYISHQVNPGSKSYNMSGIFSLVGEPNRNKLETVFQALMQRHESLRTTFAMVAKSPVQLVHETVKFEIEYYDTVREAQSMTENGKIRPPFIPEPGEPLKPFLPEEYAGHQQLEYLERIINYFIRPFDLSCMPLLRVGMIKEEEGKYIMMIDMHHIISDGVSMDVLVKDFLDLFGGRELTRLGVQYKDFSQWQNRQLNSGELEKQEEYWLNRLRGEINVLELPTDFPRPSQQSFEGDTISAEINEELTGKLKAVMAQQEVTFYMITLAIYTLLLFEYSGQNDIIVGTPVAGRRHADLEKIVGMFINVLLIRTRIEENTRFQEFLETVKENTLTAFDNQDYPFDYLAEQLDVKRDASRNPLYEVVFAQEFQVEEEFRIPGLELKPLDNERRPLKTDLRLGILEIDNKIKLLLTYSTALFRKETAENMLQHYREILEQVVTDTGIKLESINISHDYAALKANADRSEELEFNF